MQSTVESDYSDTFEGSLTLDAGQGKEILSRKRLKNERMFIIQQKKSTFGYRAMLKA